MLNVENKKIYFAGKTDKFDKVELEKFIISNGGIILNDIEDASVILEGRAISFLDEEKIYEISKSKSEIKIVPISNFEKVFSENLEIDNILMSIKLTKDSSRLNNFLKNDYFTNEQFLKFLKLFKFDKENLYSSDESRDVCIKIVERFCTLAATNHNIQYSPIGIYYTALETTSEDLLEIIYGMPNYEISEKNSEDGQPISLREVVALNPNTNLKTQIKILRNNNLNELKFLALNENLDLQVQEKLILSANDEIIKNLIKASNLSNETIFKLFQNSGYKNQILKSFSLNETFFESIINNLTDIEIIYLSSNYNLTPYMIEKIYSFNIPNAIINLSKNSLTPTNIIDEIVDKNDITFDIALAHNENLEENTYYSLYKKDDYNINISLAKNINTPKEILISLSLKRDKLLDEILCANKSTPIAILMQYQFDGGLKSILSNNETYRKFTRDQIGM